MAEAGDHVRARGIKRVALMTDKVMVGLEHLAELRKSLESAGLDVVLYDEVRVEPTDRSFRRLTFRSERSSRPYAVGRAWA